MWHWSQLATRNWRARPVRTVGALMAIALGTAAVVWVTCCYESVRRTMMSWAGNYIGAKTIYVESALGKYDQLPERLIGAIDGMPDIAGIAPRLVLRLRAIGVKGAATSAPEAIAWNETTPEMDFHGIDLSMESKVRAYTITEGRMISAQDDLHCVLDESFARENGLHVGDRIRMWTTVQNQPYELEIVGLLERRKIARFQKGMALLRLETLQQLAVKQGLVTSLDVILHDTTPLGIERARAKIRPIVRRFSSNANVTTAESRIKQIDKAQSQLQLILTLLSCVAMLTALFIILSTLSMGMIERISQLGLMRCVGVTGAQLAWLMFAEVVPLGIIGVASGVPLGLLMTLVTVWSVPEYLGEFAVSWTGMGLAVGAGLATTLVAATAPALASLTVSPLEASRPRARAPRAWLLAATGALAAGALGLQFVFMGRVQRDPLFLTNATTAIVALYLGYAMLGPVVVRVLSYPIVAAVARLSGVRTKLLQDQVGHAVWRSAGICCGIMVGLSLIVGLVVFNQSVRAGWQFPKNFPEAYIWSFNQMTADADEIVGTIGGIKEYTTANAINVIVEERKAFMEKVFLSVTWFLGCDPDSFFDMMKLEFIEGDKETAKSLLKQGEHVIVAKDFAVTREKKLGDTVKVWIGNQSQPRVFRIAGIIDSPALDIAATYFQAQSEMHVAAVGSVIGTNADLKKFYNIAGTKLVLINFRERAGDGAGRESGSTAVREEEILRDVKAALGAPQAFSGTVRELKEEIDREMKRMTTLLTAVPIVALIVAALGVGNLMTANVHSRSKQLAIMRAVGATRGLIARIVLGEALVLGLIGGALGWALGMHLARNTAEMTQRMWGLDVPYSVPWGYVLGAVGLTIGLAALAGMLPARYASRTDVVQALRAV